MTDVSRDRSRYWFYFRSHALSFLVIFLILCGATYCDSVTPSLYRQLTSSFQHGKMEELVQTALQLLAYTIASSALFLFGTYRTNVSGEEISSHLRLDLFQALQQMPFWFFTMTRSGHFISLFNHQLLGAHNGITRTVPRIVTNLLTIGMSAYQLIRSDWTIIAGLLAALPVFVFVTERMQSRLGNSHKEAHNLRAKMNDSLKSSLSASAILAQKNFNITTSARDAFASSSSQIQTSQENVIFFQDVHSRLIFLLFAMLSAAAYVFTAMYVKGSSGGDVGDIVQIVASFRKMQAPLISLGTIRLELSSTLTCFTSIFQLLDKAEIIHNQQEGQRKSNLLCISAWPGDITLDSVSFVYPSSDQLFSLDNPGSLRRPAQLEEMQRTVLKDVSIQLKAGSKVALIGPNGSGKTTLAFLLAGLYRPTMGSICTASHNYDTLEDESFRKLVGILDQDPWFEHGTILSNLLLAIPKASKSSYPLRHSNMERERAEVPTPETLKMIENACRIANILDVINDFPDKFDTQIGDNAMRLSSGQRQRLALARLVLKSPSFIILDEFNSHLDTRTENEILSALLQHFSEATILIITHRFSVLKRVNEVIHLSEGKVLEHGSHQHLLSLNGPYSQLYQEYVESL